MHSRQNSRRERIEAPMIMTAVTSSTQSHNNDSFENPAYNNNLYSDLQQPSAPVAGAAGGGGGGDK